MQRWYISFHGGEGKGAWNNIHAFDEHGSPLGKMLDEHDLPHGVELRELRGFAFGPDGDLYVANAYRNLSQILRFEGRLNHRGRHAFHSIFSAQHHANPGLAHPFDLSFGPDGNLYVPSQDTNLVGRYYGPLADADQSGGLMPYPAALDGLEDRGILPGTFIPSKRHAAHGLSTVRGTRFGRDGDLYVVDRDANAVKRYHGTSGAPLRHYTHPSLTKPVHLLPVDGQRILVGSRDHGAVFEIDTEGGGVRPLIAPGAGGLRGPGGMAIGADGRLYVCSRESKQVLRFGLDAGTPDPAPFIDGLSDYPEFIVPVAGEV